MIKLPKPTFDPREVFQTTISTVADAGFKRRLEAIEQEIVYAADEYERLATVHELYLFASSDSIGQVTKNELMANYTQRLAAQQGPGRTIYEALKSAGPNGICPWCNMRDATTLDHYLPQSVYPSVAVAPINLVPSCLPCNKRKDTHWPMTPEEQLLHPYYDPDQFSDWLGAEVVETAPAAILFIVNAPAHWDDTVRARVEGHFELFQLATQYGSQAANEISNIRGWMEDVFETEGVTGVRKHLASKARSCTRSGTQTWHGAAYRALASNDWYCEGGFART